MSLKNPRNLLIISAVIVALLAGTVLLGNYTNILPIGSNNGSQVKTCPASGGTTCCQAKNDSAEFAELDCAQKAGAGFDAKACPLDSTKPCCAGEAPPDCCPKTCPPDCTKPCCEGEAAPDCCPMSSPSVSANTGCCPKTSNVTE